MPITVMDTVLLTNREDMQKVLDACADVASRGGLIMLNFHQRQLRETEYPFVVMTYTRLLETAKKDNAWMATMKEIGEYVERRLTNNV